MKPELTDEWIIHTMRKNDWCLNEIVFVYPEGPPKKTLHVLPGEKVCASITDVLYLSRSAVYVRNKTGHYARLPWSEMQQVYWTLRKVDGNIKQAINYKMIDGTRVVAIMPFDAVPAYFGDVHERCLLELTPTGKICKLPGPSRLVKFQRPVAKDAPWAKDYELHPQSWMRELACSCGKSDSFKLQYLGKLLKSNLLADGPLRQCLEAHCVKCDKSIEVFDSFHHGYNAVICAEYKNEPADRHATNAYLCVCGKNRFALGVVALYDADAEDLVGSSKEKRSEAYGWFQVSVTCKSCTKVTHVVDYETA